MNWDDISGSWPRLRGRIKEQWGKLTDDDLDVINGKYEQLVGRVQYRYGVSRGGDRGRRVARDREHYRVTARDAVASLTTHLGQEGENIMRRTRSIMAVALLGFGLVSGCGTRDQASVAHSDSLLSSNPAEQDQGSLNSQVPDRPGQTRTYRPAPSAPRNSIPSGTSVPVTLGSSISSETANVGDGWTGTVEHAVVVDGRSVIPAGSVVHGTVTSLRPARKGDRAMIALGLSSLEIDGHRYTVHGSTEPIVAGSTRARNLGGIAAGTAAGALIGRAVGGSGKGAIVGGIIGGAAATGAVAKSKGYQVNLKSGASLRFVTNEPVAVRK